MEKVKDVPVVSKAVSEEQLIKLQELVKNLQQYQLKIGDVEVQKHQLLHGFAEAQNGLEVFQKELKEEYGNVTIDINSGDIKEVEDEPNTED
tara:strand:- start:517 stop:792 length:276 start_codon:yes stop_codon:yes gene_type:complete